MKIITLLLVLFAVACSPQGGRSSRGSEIKPIGTIDMYAFDLSSERNSTRAGLIVCELGAMGYTLKNRSNGKTICRNVHYVKTFGGVGPTAWVHVINNRYVAYPETLKGSNIPRTMFNQMKGRTRVYDLKKGQMLWSSDYYKYDHNVPLKYDYDDLLSLAWRKNR